MNILGYLLLWEWLTFAHDWELAGDRKPDEYVGIVKRVGAIYMINYFVHID